MDTTSTRKTVQETGRWRVLRARALVVQKQPAALWLLVYACRACIHQQPYVQTVHYRCTSDGLRNKCIMSLGMHAYACCEQAAYCCSQKHAYGFHSITAFHHHMPDHNLQNILRWTPHAKQQAKPPHATITNHLSHRTDCNHCVNSSQANSPPSKELHPLSHVSSHSRAHASSLWQPQRHVTIT